MAMVPDEIKANIEKLISQFAGLGLATRKLNEANTKKDYIEPLFAYLGWDVHDSNEVSAEERASGGRVDYAFKLHGVSQFYLEAKPPRADLSKPEYAKQAITYTYNKGITWAVLTDFEELKVFNGQTGHLFLNLSYHDFLKNFDDLWLLSRESFEQNALSLRAEKYGALPPRLRIEQRLYSQLRQWREELFAQLHLYNKHLTLNQVDEVIQRLFNRLIFIRTCEDRGIEEKVLLGSIHEWHHSGCEEELIEVLQGMFREFDRYYDSDLFNFHLTDQVFIEGILIEKIINGLYELPKGMASYDFSIIDADVLGAVYEQYLGHVAAIAKRRVAEAQMRMDLGFRAEEVFELTAKKQKRKEQGIYYTPKFVVDYIVKETIGLLLQERSDNEIRNLKILDMACGSGSFLIRSYEELLYYHAKQRCKDVSELDQWERLPILTNNIFGVDLDQQAVEIARLNLLIRSLAKREVLPSLANNICRGNSLISGTDEELRRYFGDNWAEKQAFNWGEKFPQIIDTGGFDVIIGNPPYVNESRGNKELFRELKRVPKLQQYYEKNMDLFNYFLEQGLDLLKEGGLLGYIIPSYWQDRTGAWLLRKKIISESNIVRFIDFGDFRVFQDSLGHHSSILILQKTSSSERTSSLSYLKIVVDKAIDYEKQRDHIVNTLRSDTMATCSYEISANKFIIQRSGQNMLAAFKMKPYFYFSRDQVVRGVDTSPSDSNGKGVFVMGQAEVDKVIDELTLQEKEFLKPFYHAHQVDRYYYDPQNFYWLIYTDLERRRLLENKKENYPTIVAHLDSYKDVITSDNKPYGLHRPKKECNFTATNKLLFVRKTPYPKFILVPIPYFFDESMYLILYDETSNPHYLLGILNSKLAAYWFAIHKKQGEQLQVDKEIILSLPIRRIDFDNSEEKKIHDNLVKLVDKMLELNKRLASIRTTPCNERDEIQREIERTDRKIDNLVYDLYGLDAEERKIVEEGGI